MFPFPGPSAWRAALVLSCAVLPCACRSNELPESIWPPADFRIRVRTVEPDDAAPTYRSFLVWADGVAMYRETETVLSGVLEELPIYRTVAVYRLDPRTTRTLARELQRAGLFEVDAPVDENRELIGGEASIAWWAHGARGFASRRQLDRGPLERSLAVVDAYVPSSHEFSGEPPQVRHVDEVPEPLAWTKGALEAHVEVFRSREEGQLDGDFLREIFALAVAAGDAAIARDALSEIEALGPRGASGEPLDRAEWERAEIEPLRRILRDLGVLGEAGAAASR